MGTNKLDLKIEKDLLADTFKSYPWFKGVGISSTPVKGVLKLVVRVKHGKEEFAKDILDNLELESKVEIEGVGNIVAY